LIAKQVGIAKEIKKNSKTAYNTNGVKNQTFKPVF
jgi:hypothetical protein